jgi:uncharacterized protein YebE (UPF0316 family)
MFCVVFFAFLCVLRVLCVRGLVRLACSVVVIVVVVSVICVLCVCCGFASVALCVRYACFAWGVRGGLPPRSVVVRLCVPIL